MRNGPNGEFQFTPNPTETRGFGVLPKKDSENGAMPNEPSGQPELRRPPPPGEGLSGRREGTAEPFDEGVPRRRRETEDRRT